MAPPRTLANVEQRWVVGAHAKVGGDYETDLLAQAPLRWMMQKAKEGLTFRSEVVPDDNFFANGSLVLCVTRLAASRFLVYKRGAAAERPFSRQ
jgi:hypothetical protein